MFMSRMANAIQTANTLGNAIHNAFLRVPSPRDCTFEHEFQRGVVRFYDPEKGFGFIVRPDQEDLYFHASRYRPVELDFDAMRIREKELEWERVEIPVKRNSPVIETDEDQILHTLTPKVKTIEKVKLDKVPKPGDILLFTSDWFKMREGTRMWMHYQNLEELRRKLSDHYCQQIDEISRLPIYQVYRTVMVKGIPRANNAKKCFEVPITPQTRLFFEGNDVPALHRAMERQKHKELHDFDENEIQYTCFQRLHDSLDEVPFPKA